MFLLYVSVITIIPLVFSYKVTHFWVKKNNIEFCFCVILYFLWRIVMFLMCII